MFFAAAVVSVVPVRREPSHTSEMVNQLLFGETVKVQEEKAGWWFIKSLHDDYEGWVQALPLEPIEEKLATLPITWIMNAGGLGEYLDINGAQKMICPLGACLTGFDGEDGQIGSFTYTYNGKAATLYNSLSPAENALLEQLPKWWNAPYLWGGRTPMGVDCSGFTQVLFRTIGIDLLRDAVHQSGQGEVVDFWQQSRCGDLAFFDDQDGKIQHVGVLLNPFEIIHAYGKIRKDKMDHLGIVNDDSGERTHRLRIIKRYF